MKSLPTMHCSMDLMVCSNSNKTFLLQLEVLKTLLIKPQHRVPKMLLLTNKYQADSYKEIKMQQPPLFRQLMKQHNLLLNKAYNNNSQQMPMEPTWTLMEELKDSAWN